MTGHEPSGITFDHIALAVRNIDEELEKLRTKLGATIVSGDKVPGYRFAMLRVGDAESGMNVELLEPRMTEVDDFLERFLQRHGAGPHHITFLQPDIRASVNELERRGYQMMRTKLDFGPWQESFIHPAHGCGSVVQVAGSTIPTPPMADLLEAAHNGNRSPDVPYDERGEDQFWWAQNHPPRPTRSPAVLERVVVNIADLEIVRDVYIGVLGAEVIEEDAESIELAWGATGRIRFVRSHEARVNALEVAGMDEEFTIGSAHFRHRAR